MVHRERRYSKSIMLFCLIFIMYEQNLLFIFLSKTFSFNVIHNYEAICLTEWSEISFGAMMLVVALDFEPHQRSCQFYNCIMLQRPFYFLEKYLDAGWVAPIFVQPR